MKIFNLHIGRWYLCWHWSKSITWRWILRVSKWGGKTRLGGYAHRNHKFKDGKYHGLMAGLNTKLLCVHFQSQPNIFKEQP